MRPLRSSSDAPRIDRAAGGSGEIPPVQQSTYQQIEAKQSREYSAKSRRPPRRPCCATQGNTALPIRNALVRSCSGTLFRPSARRSVNSAGSNARVVVSRSRAIVLASGDGRAGGFEREATGVHCVDLRLHGRVARARAGAAAGDARGGLSRRPFAGSVGGTATRLPAGPERDRTCRRPERHHRVPLGAERGGPPAGAGERACPSPGDGDRCAGQRARRASGEGGNLDHSRSCSRSAPIRSTRGWCAA